MKCRAAVLLLCVLTAAGAAAQSGTNGQFTVSDPNQLFGPNPALLNSTNATFTIDFQTVNATGQLTFFHFHSDSTDPTTQDSWLFTFGNSAGIQSGTYQIDGASITSTLSNSVNACSPSTGSVSFGSLNVQPDGTVNQMTGTFNLNCTATDTVGGTFNFTAPAGTGGGGGGGTGGGGGGGSISAGIGKIPGLGTLPVGPGVTLTPTAPPAPTLSVTAPTTLIDLDSGETATAKITTFANESLASDVSLSATGAPGFTFAFNPATIHAPGSGTSTLTIGTGDGVQVGNQRIEIVARGAGGVIGRTSLNLRVFCDPPLVLGIDQPRSATIGNGQTAQLTVKASGSGPFAYQWYEGHRGSLVFPIAGATSATFTTPALTSGTEYWVRVTNPCGSVDSQNAQVNVTP